MARRQESICRDDVAARRQQHGLPAGIAVADRACGGRASPRWRRDRGSDPNAGYGLGREFLRSRRHPARPRICPALDDAHIHSGKPCDRQHKAPAAMTAAGSVTDIQLCYRLWWWRLRRHPIAIQTTPDASVRRPLATARTSCDRDCDVTTTGLKPAAQPLPASGQSRQAERSPLAPLLNPHLSAQHDLAARRRILAMCHESTCQR